MLQVDKLNCFLQYEIGQINQNQTSEDLNVNWYEDSGVSVQS